MRGGKLADARSGIGMRRGVSNGSYCPASEGPVSG